ncbi:hypothetical protein [Aliikangiella sp. IMCC44359]|uniref:hypothetical protein n=1 Tax=Aliikangiella sp. IMCC44359 TaxID=3459125 RepID=UPI00403AA37B
MNKALKECIETICIERDYKWDKSFDLVDRLIEVFGEEELSERIFNETPKNVPFEVIADILNIAIWNTSDNGSRIQNTAENWLRERKDSRKMLIALSLEILPFGNRAEAKEILKDLPDELRAVDPFVTRMLDAWEKQEG